MRSAAIKVALVNEQDRLPIDAERLCASVRAVLVGEGIVRANISLAIVDDPTMHDLNRRYLNHDEPTDVISFALDHSPGFVDGEIIASADTAVSAASRFSWLPADELLLYIIHGALHLVGYDDLTDEKAPQMRDRERHYLGQFGLSPRYDDHQATLRELAT